MSAASQPYIMYRDDYDDMRLLMTEFTDNTKEPLDKRDIQYMAHLMFLFADVMEVGEFGSLGLDEEEAKECEELCRQVTMMCTAPGDWGFRKAYLQIALFAGILVFGVLVAYLYLFGP